MRSMVTMATSGSEIFHKIRRVGLLRPHLNGAGFNKVSYSSKPVKWRGRRNWHWYLHCRFLHETVGKNGGDITCHIISLS